MTSTPLPQPASRPTHEVTVHRHRIPMRDGVRLFATAWHPDGAGPYPALVNYDPYRSSDMRTLARGNVFHYLARHGYVVLHLGVRGTDASEGTVADEYLPQEQEDGYDAVEWVAAQPWCSGSIGMTGTSYAGFTCLQVAMRRPPHLKAIIPIYATDDRYTDDVHYTGGALQAICDLPTWATMMICMNALPPHESLGAELARVWQTHLEGNEPYQFNWLAHPTDGPYWRHASLRPDYDRIECAVFMIGGWMDAYTNSTVRIFQRLSSPKKALIGPWAHIFPEWGAPGPAINFMGQGVRWFDHWLKGIDTGIRDEPAFTVYMQQCDPPSRNRTYTTGYWRAARAWPVHGAGEQRLHLGPGGTLDAAAVSKGDEGSHSFTYRATVGATNRSWPGEPWIGCPEDQRPDEVYSLVYTSEPLQSRLEILGWPRARLSFASTAPVVNLVCKLCDVAPDGASALVTWGVLNATHRNSHTHPEPLVPGQRYDLEVTLDVTGWVFEPGHRIRLDVSGADWPNIWPSPYRAENTVWVGGEGGSGLTLPAAPAGRPEDGPAFGEPAMPLDRYVMQASPMQLRVIRDPRGEKAWFEMSGSQRGNLPDEEVAFEYDYRSSFVASDRDPARAALSAEHSIRINRHGTTTTAQAHGHLESTEDAFHLVFDLRVTVDDAERFRRQWMRSFPRQLV